MRPRQSFGLADWQRQSPGFTDGGIGLRRLVVATLAELTTKGIVARHQFVGDQSNWDVAPDVLVVPTFGQPIVLQARSAGKSLSPERVKTYQRTFDQKCDGPTTKILRINAGSSIIEIMVRIEMLLRTPHRLSNAIGGPLCDEYTDPMWERATLILALLLERKTIDTFRLNPEDASVLVAMVRTQRRRIKTSAIPHNAQLLDPGTFYGQHMQGPLFNGVSVRF